LVIQCRYPDSIQLAPEQYFTGTETVFSRYLGGIRLISKR
jgi:hypothetical protein